MRVTRDTWLVFLQAFGQTARRPEILVVLLFQPVLFLFFFGPLLQNSLRGVPRDEVINLYVPGLMIQLALFGTLFACFSLTTELRAGVIERFRVTPISRLALLLGRSLRDVAVLLIQELALVLMALPLGLDVGPAALAQMFVMVGLFGLGISAVSDGLAITLRQDEVLGPLINAISLPLLLLSGILIPMTFAPDWLEFVSRLNPMTYVVDAARDIFAGTLTSGAVVAGMSISAGLAVVSLVAVTRIFTRSVT